MKRKWLFILSAVGVIGALAVAWVASWKIPVEAPAFEPTNNPFAQGIYANGIIESDQASGANINLYPEVAASVSRVLVHEGEHVSKGVPLIALDDAVQRAATAQQSAQAVAAAATLAQMKAQPRPEALAVAAAQVEQAKAAKKTAEDQYDKLQHAIAINPKAVSRDAQDNAANALKVAAAALDVAQRQYQLTRAGTWSYDLRAQEAQASALKEAAQSSSALLAKYVLTAPVDGVVMSINTSVGSYVSAQGAYSSYTEGYAPVLVMSGEQETMAVRCFIDEILVHRLPPPERIVAQMTIRGTEVKIPLEFVRVQPYVTPKIELSNQREERVDLRVLPVIFRFKPPAGATLYPGEMVDVYIGQKP